MQLFISTMTTVQIDHRFYPHIIDRVFFCAPRASLLALRASCKGWRRRADEHLVEHLSLVPTGRGDIQDPIPHGYDTTVPPLADDAVDLRRLPPVDLAMLGDHVRVLDIDTRNWRLLPERKDCVLKLRNVSVVRNYGSYGGYGFFERGESPLVPPCDMLVADDIFNFRCPNIRKNGMFLLTLNWNSNLWALDYLESWFRGRQHKDIEIAVLFLPPILGCGPVWGNDHPYLDAGYILENLGILLPWLSRPYRFTLVNSLAWRVRDPNKEVTSDWEQCHNRTAAQSEDMAEHERDHAAWVDYLRDAIRDGLPLDPPDGWAGDTMAEECLDWIKFETIEDFEARVGKEKFELALSYKGSTL
jgi:hypothetical protein